MIKGGVESSVDAAISLWVAISNSMHNGDRSSMPEKGRLPHFLKFKKVKITHFSPAKHLRFSRMFLRQDEAGKLEFQGHQKAKESLKGISGS